MDWPTAALLLGVLGTIAVAIIKFVPQRTVMRSANGDKCATKEDVTALLQAIHSLHQLVRDHDRYTKERNHDILNAFAQISGTLQLVIRDIVTLLERARLNHRGHDDGD